MSRNITYHTVKYLWEEKMFAMCFAIKLYTDLLSRYLFRIFRSISFKANLWWRHHRNTSDNKQNFHSFILAYVSVHQNTQTTYSYICLQFPRSVDLVQVQTRDDVIETICSPVHKSGEGISEKSWNDAGTSLCGRRRRSPPVFVPPSEPWRQV